MNSKDINTPQDNKKDLLSNIIKKTSEVAKQAAQSVQKSASDLSEKAQKAYIEKQRKKYNPITSKEFKSKNFKIPNVIEIVDDAVRRDIEVCEGAIGWLEDHKGVEVLHLYDEFVNKCGLKFIPSPRCDDVYCVDNFNKEQFINTSFIFHKTNEERLAELAHIAYSLGAKKCSIEIVETDSTAKSSSTSLAAIIPSTKALNVAYSSQNESYNKSSGKRELQFDGNNEPVQPDLKWFAYDENIKGLIEMRLSNKNSIKSTVLELNGSASAIMSKKTACAIDNVMKVSGSMSMESQIVREYSSKLLFSVEFY